MLLADNNQLCDNQDNLVTTFFYEVVTAVDIAVSTFAGFVTTKTTSLRDGRTHIRARTCAHELGCHTRHIRLFITNINNLACDNLVISGLSQVVLVVTSVFSNRKGLFHD